MPFSLTRLNVGDGALLQQTSHWDVRFDAGRPHPSDFAVPVVFTIDPDTEGRRLPTMFRVPTFVARRAFHAVLVDGGVDNVEAHAASIVDEDTGAQIDDYLVLNVLDKIACASLSASRYREIGPGMRVIDELVLDRSRLPEKHLFLLSEDPLKIVVSDALHARLVDAGFDDLYFEALPLA